MTAVYELSSQVGVTRACQAMAVPRSSFYRSRQSVADKSLPESVSIGDDSVNDAVSISISDICVSDVTGDDYVSNDDVSFNAVGNVSNDEASISVSDVCLSEGEVSLSEGEVSVSDVCLSEGEVSSLSVSSLSDEVSVSDVCLSEGDVIVSNDSVVSVDVSISGSESIIKVNDSIISSPRALSEQEVFAVRELLNSPRFVDQTPREIYATLLDEGSYLCSWRTMYRILKRYQEVQERRDQLRHPRYAKPQLMATGPNQLWSWDITKLLGPTKGKFFYLYVIIDVYSRYIVGWLLAEREEDVLAEHLVQTTCENQGILPNQLTLHADRGSSMKSKLLASLLSDLGVIKTHSRPRVSNDNPYSESQFKTMKYQPDYPKFFGSLEDARAWVKSFIDWYNKQHHHTGLGLLTPESVHYGQAPALLKLHQEVLDAAYAAHPERFVKKPPTVPSLPEAVWINRPQPLLEVGDPL